MLEDLEGHLERRSRWYLAAASLLYFALTAITADRKPLWYDELFTFHVAKQERVADVLHVLATGADIHPPPDYVLRHFSMRALGVGEFSDRLPSILAFWVMCLALRRIVAFRCGAIFGMIAFLAPLSTLAYHYAYEGRGYALMLAGGAVALAAWQAAAEGGRRAISLALMGVGLVTALTTHYYGILILVPLIVGEAVRARSRHRVDRALTLVVVAAPLALLPILPYLSVQAAQMGTFWSAASVSGTIQAYWWLLNETSLVLPTFLVLLVATFVLDRGAAPERGLTATVPVHEWSAAVAALLVPAACYVLARLTTGAFHFRYALVTILGVILAGTFAASRLFANNRRVRIALLAAVAMTGTYQMMRTARESHDPGAGRARQAAVERALPDRDIPVVHGTLTSFMQATRYANPALHPRMYYLTNREASLRFVGNDNGQWAIANIAPLVPGHVVDYREFLERHRDFLLVNPRTAKDWILPQLIDDGAKIQYLVAADGIEIFEVQLPPSGLDSSLVSPGAPSWRPPVIGPLEIEPGPTDPIGAASVRSGVAPSSSSAWTRVLVVRNVLRSSGAALRECGASLGWRLRSAPSPRSAWAPRRNGWIAHNHRILGCDAEPITTRSAPPWTRVRELTGSAVRVGGSEEGWAPEG